MKPVYTISDVAGESRQGRTKIYADIKQGKLRAVKNGRRTFILGEDFAAYLASFKPA
jgi:hypothetical protein